MATALAYPDVEKGGRGKKSVLNTELSVSSGYLAHARFVLRNCRDKALEVLRNSKYPLTVAIMKAIELGLDKEEVKQMMNDAINSATAFFNLGNKTAVRAREKANRRKGN